MPLSHVVYVAYISAFAHGTAQHIEDDLRRQLRPLLKAGYCTIPPVMLLNLWAVPLRFRVLFLNVTLGVGYSAFLNWSVNRSDVSLEAAEPASSEGVPPELTRRNSSYS